MNSVDRYLPGRVERAVSGIEDLGAEAVLISKQENVIYLSDFKSSNCFVLLTGKENYIITDFRYIEAAGNNKAGLTPVLIDRVFTVFDFINKLGIKSLAVEEDDISYNFYKMMCSKFKGILKSADGLVEKLRIIKDEYEMECLRKAEAIGDLAFTHLQGYVKAGMTEKEVAFELEYFMRTNGADCLSFDSIVVSGSRSSLPHGMPSDKKIEQGDFITLDYGCKIGGYCSDMTRNLLLGEPTKEQEDVYNIVKEAQQKSLEAVFTGKSVVDIDMTARDIIKYYGYGEYFGHGLGHGVGLEIHEAPTLGPKGTETLSPGMAVTIEPGIYLPGKFGVRIEDLVLVTESGYEVLSSSNKDLIII
ncbi:MAG: aminopeptidase P family protein [Firmicutes bacterium]|nr:aminopeptidase P family protein [Bacillota bacterium]